MSRIVCVLVVLGEASGAWGQTPTIENVYPSGECDPCWIKVEPGERADIPNTSRTITVPKGTAIISWTLHATNAGEAVVRPIIGTREPVEGIRWLSVNVYYSNSGSWATPVESGEITVKLEHEDIGGFSKHIVGFFPNSITWTLIVFPDTAPVHDSDNDGDVDLEDYAAFQNTMTGPDGDIDLEDYATFHNTMTGPQD